MGKKSLSRVGIIFSEIRGGKQTNVAKFSSLQRLETGDSHSTLTLDGGQCGASEACGAIFGVFVSRNIFWQLL